MISREAAIGALEHRRDQYLKDSQTWIQIQMDILALRALPAAQPATVTVEEAARVLLDAFGEDKWGGWEFPMVGLNAAIDAHGLALTDISRLGFRCSPQTMLAKSFRAALRVLAGDKP
jgi:hypothetical protein